MTRERWEQILFAHVSDETVQDMLNQYVLELESSNAKLRELVRDFDKCLDTSLWLASEAGYPIMPDQKLFASLRPRMRELEIEMES